MTKMTKVQAFEEALDIASDLLSDEALEIIQKEISLLTARAKKNAEKRAAKRDADEPLIEQLVEIINNSTDFKENRTAVLASEIGISTSKGTALLRKAVERGLVERVQPSAKVIYFKPIGAVEEGNEDNED